MSLLTARQITHAYRRPWGRRRPSLLGVDLDLGAGECWGLVGPNGSGKSTLLRILAGLATPLAGEVSVLGSPAGSRRARRAVGYAPEHVSWPPNLRVGDVLTELAALSTGRDIMGRVERAAAVVRLQPLLARRLGTLSWGQARRVVVAQALLDDPPVLLLDEAFSGLDSLILRELMEDLDARMAAGTGLVVASHRIEDLVGLCTHVLVLRDGRVVQAGPADAILAHVSARGGLTSLLGEAP